MLSGRTLINILSGLVVGAGVSWLTLPKAAGPQQPERQPSGLVRQPDPPDIAAGRQRPTAEKPQSTAHGPLKEHSTASDVTSAGAPNSAAPPKAATTPAEEPSSSAATSPAPPAPAPADDPLLSPHEKPVHNAKELVVAEVQCDKLSPDECIRAADAYRAGRVVEKDQRRIDRHEKVALTYYVRLCNDGDPGACFQLARLYRNGEIVQRDERNARALVQRAYDLCKNEDTPVCQSLRRRARPTGELRRSQE